MARGVVGSNPDSKSNFFGRETHYSERLLCLFLLGLPQFEGRLLFFELGLGRDDGRVGVPSDHSGIVHEIRQVGASGLGRDSTIRGIWAWGRTHAELRRNRRLRVRVSFCVLVNKGINNLP